MRSLTSVARRCWDSPTITSWASVAARAVGMLAILPLALTRLSTVEIALWLLFGTVSGLLLIVDMGFASTFARVIAYGVAGATTIRDLRVPQSDTATDGPNWALVARIIGTMQRIYAGMALAWFGLLFFGGTWFALPMIRELRTPEVGWISWAVMVTLSSIRFYAVQFSSRLLGYNRVALLRRWEAVLLLLAALVNVAALELGLGLIGLVTVTHGLLVINGVLNWRLATAAEHDAPISVRDTAFDPSLFQDVWPAVWRSGIGMAMSTGLVQLTGVFYARVAAPDQVASYLLALTFIRYLTQFGQAPFYSKLPALAQLHAANRPSQTERLAQRGMKVAHWILVTGLVSVGILAEPALRLLRSHAAFVPVGLWILMSIATFVTRYGAMHLQLYSITNDIVWHIANGVSGVLYLALVTLTLSSLGVYAFPACQLLSDLAFYVWYSTIRSYRILQSTFWSFEARTSLPPLLVLATYIGLMLLR